MAFTSASDECTAWWNHFNYQNCLPKSLFVLTNTMKTANVPIISNRISTKRLLILSGLVILLISKQPANGTISALSWIFIPAKSSPGISPENQMLIWSWLRSKKPTKNETHHSVSCFILTEEHNILHLYSLHVVQSFSKKGYPFDNACCESFFKYLKKEEINRKAYHSLQELQLSVFEYIEGFYNAKRPHGALGMMTPNEKEECYWAQLWAALLDTFSL